MARAKKTESKLEQSLAAKLPSDVDAYLTTLGRNRKTGFVNDPYRVSNLPGGYVTKAVSMEGGDLGVATSEGWIPFEPDQVTNKTHESDKAYISNFDVSNGFVIVGYGKHAMVMCYANERIIRARRQSRKALWNEQLDARTGKGEGAEVKVKDAEGRAVVGGYTTDAGHRLAISHSERGFEATAEDPADTLWQRGEEA